MISKSAILQKLTPFTNSSVVLVNDQTTDDIINGLLNNHKQYEKEYDKISEIFLGDNEKETARNVFNFLKWNVPYFIEPIKKQTLRSPSAIVAIKSGADCKSYASFINGIFSSLNRKGIYHIPMAYRFASYRPGIQDPQHVFAVMYPGTKNEIWIDPVLDRFDQKKQPNYYKDKKINMALIAMSGTSTQSNATLEEMQTYRDKLVNVRDKMLNAGQIVPGSQNELQFKVAINKVTRAIQNASINGTGERGDKGYDGDGVGFLPAIPVMVSTIQQFLPIVQGFFSNQANPNDWKGWDAQDIAAGKPVGSSAGTWVLKDGDSISNEASNILSWINANSINKVIGVNAYTGQTITKADIIKKLRKGGLNQEADTLEGLLSSAANLLPGTTTAGFSPFVLLALGGAAIYMFTRKK